MFRHSLRAAIGAACLAVAGVTWGGTLANLRDAARHTVLTNPEVQAAYHEFTAAQEQTRVAQGGYLPRIDVEAGVGKESNDYPDWEQNDFSRDRVSFSLNQMLYDGFLTRNEVRRLNLAARTRYYEVLSASEAQTALTARTYYDVLRYRALVDLSQENYATHRMIYEQIERRVKAGISRRVDLEQAAGRLALAESNLLTDVTNLYDVGMRYQRVVGEAPAPALEEPEITPNLLPATLKETLANAYVRSPLMNAAIANVWSADAAVDVQKSSMLPRIDVRARQDVWHDKDDVDGRTEEGVVELVMTYNIYNGGSDAAEKRRLLQKSNQAVDLRVKTCRDIRQEVSIAYNDLHQLEEQKIYLDRHQLSIAKAREAYRRQFDIGQRTLLDMLDTENEYYEARRAYINAERDQQVAYSRALAGIGGLVEALELGHDLHEMKGPPGSPEDVPDMYAVCPPEDSGAVAVDKEALFREAIQKQGGRMPLQDPRPPEPLPYQKGGEFEPAAETAPAPDAG